MRTQYALLAPGAGAGLCLASIMAQGAPLVQVSSLSGLRDAIDSAPVGGRSIQLADGTYDQSKPIKIENHDNITISGATGNFDDTVIQGPGINDSSLGINVKVKGSQNVTLRNLTLKDSFYHGVQVKQNSDGFTADHVKTIDNGEAGFKVSSSDAGSGVGYSDNGTIKNSTISFSTTGQRSVVEGIDIVGSKNWRIQGNTLSNIKKADGGPAYAVFAKGNAQDMVFTNNTVKNSFIGLSFGGGGTSAQFFRDGDTTYETRGGAIRDNLIYDLDDAGIYLNKAKGFLVAGNTVLRNGAGTGAISARYPQSSGTIKNNQTSGPIKLRDDATATLQNNTKIPADTPVDDLPKPGDGGDDGGGGTMPPPVNAVAAPGGWRLTSLFLIAGAAMLAACRRRLQIGHGY